MHFLKYIFIFLASHQFIMGQDLDAYQWKNRVLVLVAQEIEDDDLLSQFQEVKTKKEDTDERDIIVFLVTPKTVYTMNMEVSNINASKVYESLSINLDYKGLILLGKDGGIKLKKPFKIDSKEIFNLIDSMPMRRSEMKKQKLR